MTYRYFFDSLTDENAAKVASVTLAIFVSFLTGFRDAFKLGDAALLIVSSRTIRERIIQCTVLNIVIFVGSVIMLDFLINPLIRFILTYKPPEEVQAFGANISFLDNTPINDYVDRGQVENFGSLFFELLSQILIIYPFYALSFILNTIWYQDIADHAFVSRGGRRHSPPFTFQRWVKAIAEELYRALLIVFFLAQTALVAFVPIIGSWLVVLHFSWLYALYSFEYKWALEGWPLERRLTYFEQHWAYFAGFGAFSACLTVYVRKFISAGVYAGLFPIFLILAITAEPVPSVVPSALTEHRAGSHFPVPIFRLAKALNDIMLRNFQQGKLLALLIKLFLIIMPFIFLFSYYYWSALTS